jgi:O-antigen ligase
LPVYTFYGRTAGTFGNPNFAAGFLALLFPYLLFYPRLRPIYKILLTPVFFTALIFTQSRSGLLAFLVVLILFLARKSKRALIAVFPISLLILAILIMLIPRYSPFENQLVIWQKALVAVTKKPVFGWGVERFDIAFQKTLIPSKDFDLYHIRVDKAHNEILETAVAGGLISALVYLVLITTTLIYLLKNHRSPWAKANLFAFVAYLILSQLNVLNVTEYLFFYLILASLSQSQSTDLKSPPTL